MSEHPVTTVRRQNLAALIAQFPTRAEFGKRHDIDDPYLHQLLNPKYPFGERAARKLEKKIGLKAGALDTPPDRQVIYYPLELAASAALELAEKAVAYRAHGTISEAQAKIVLEMLDALAAKGEKPASC